jgi:hypothetical protein
MQATDLGRERHPVLKDILMLDDLLREYYASGDPESLRRIVLATQPLVIGLLAHCVADPAIRVRIWYHTIRKLRQSRNHPELRFDLSRGTAPNATRGLVIALALHYAFRWLVWYEHPDAIVD